MEIISDLFSGLWEVWSEMFSGIMEILPKILFFCLWVVTAAVVLPAVFIAGNLYPLWVEWGEDF